MDRLRRTVLRASFSGGASLFAGLAGWLQPLLAWAGEWPKAAFEAKSIKDALKNAGVAEAASSGDILVKAPEIAENGAQVPIEILSKIPGSEAIYIFVDKNPQPLASSFDFMNGAEAFVSTRIKMGETSNLRVVVRAGGRHYMVMREVKVTIGGCGA